MTIMIDTAEDKYYKTKNRNRRRNDYMLLRMMIGMVLLPLRTVHLARVAPIRIGICELLRAE
jgi:hypothetical protein